MDFNLLTGMARALRPFGGVGRSSSEHPPLTVLKGSSRGLGGMVALLLASSVNATVVYDNYRGTSAVPANSPPPNYVNWDGVTNTGTTFLSNLIAFAAGGTGNIASSGTAPNVDWSATNPAQLCDNRSVALGGNINSAACQAWHMGRVTYAVIKFPAAGNYTFSSAHDDEVQLDFSTSFVPANASNYRNFNFNHTAGQVGAWTTGENFENFPKVFNVPQAGACYVMRLYWNNHSELNKLRLQWTKPDATTEIIPAGQLYDPSQVDSYDTCSTIPSDLAIHKAGPTTFTGSSWVNNNPFTYTITVWNKGPVPVTDAVVFSDTLPAGLVAGNGGGGSIPSWTCTGATPVTSGLTTTFTSTGTLAVNTGSATPPASGALISCSTSVRYPSAGTANSLTNTASLLVSDLTPDNNSSSVTSVRAAGVAVRKTGPATVVQGSNFQYALQVFNNSGGTRNGVIVQDQLPVGVQVTAASVNAGTVSCTPLNTAGALLTCTMNSGAPNFTTGTNRTITLTAQASNLGSIINYAATAEGGSGSPATPPGPSCNNTNTSCDQWQTTVNEPTYTVAATAGAGGTASCSPATVNSGGNSTCTATPNAGQAFTGWTGACASFGTNPTCNLSNITANQSSVASFTPTYTVAATAGAGGTASCSPATVNSGGNSTCTAVPGTGYVFSGWTGEPQCTTAATCAISNITSNKNLVANFVLAEPKPVPVDSRTMLLMLGLLLAVAAAMQSRRARR